MTITESPALDASAALLRALREILPAERILLDPPSRRTYDCDGLQLHRQQPMLVVLPETVEQVQALMRLCHRERIPVVPRGAGTGLSAGATPHPAGIVVSLAAMDRILALDPDNQLARVQPGVSNIAISDAAAPHGLFYAPDPSSQIACSIGGNVAENSGGVHCLKYGLTVHNVLGITLVTAEGDLVELGGAGLDSPGPDLLALLCGSEGLLGMVVEVTVRLLPRPQETAVLMAGFGSVRAAGEAVGTIIASGVIPAGLEMMDALAIQAAEDFARAGYPRDAAALLLCEIDGGAAEVAAVEKRCRELLTAAGATSLTVARDPAEQERLWRGRKSAFPAVGRLSRDYYCMDGSIPRSRIADVLEEISRLSRHYDLAVANVFHAGDGNLHPLILFDASDPESVTRAEAFGAAILEHSVAVGGSITGEHGVGLEKLRQMPSQFTREELLQLEEIKAALDPQLLLNPGKGIPILRRCQEYRALDGQR
jgi:glycolate oxidase